MPHAAPPSLIKQRKGRGFVDLTTFETELIPVNAPLSRVRISPSGDAILVVSDRVKAAWVLR